MSERIAYFNAAAAKWDDLPKAAADKLEYIVSFLPTHSGVQVIDAGCGTGILLPFIRARIGGSGQIYAVDFAAEMLKQARAKYNWPNLTFIQSDVTSLDLPAASIDAIICYSLYPHLPDKESALSAFARLLKPRGRLIIAHSNSRQAINEIHQSLGGPVAHDLLPPVGETAALFSLAGLRVPKTRDDEQYYLIVAEK